MYGFQYDPAGTRCLGSPQPGNLALREWVLTAFPTLRDGGIYNCRQVRGGGSLSLHGEGRANDFMVPSPSSPTGTRLAVLLVAHAHLLGVQQVIWNRQDWNSIRRTWDGYGGVNPHTDHVHVELCWDAAKERPLTYNQIELAVNPPLGEDDDMHILDADGQSPIVVSGSLVVGVSGTTATALEKDGVKRTKITATDHKKFREQGV